AAAAEQQPEGRYLERCFRRADEGDVAVPAEHVDVGVDVVINGNGIEDKVEAAGMLLHLIRIGGNDDFIGTQAQRILLLAWRSGEYHDMCAESLGELDSHVSQSTKAGHTDFFPREVTPTA